MRGTSVHDQHACSSIPDLERLSYYYGQALGAPDLKAEQAYFREKMKLHNRCLHGYGVVCGLRVVPEAPPEGCEPVTDEKREAIVREIEKLRALATELRGKDRERLEDIEAKIEELRRRLDEMPGRPEPRGPRPRPALYVECGIALDCRGNELIVREPIRIEPLRLLGAAERRRLEAGPASIYVSLCYDEQPTYPTRPVVQDACGATTSCIYGRRRDSVCVRVSLDAPAEDGRCETCCDDCGDACLLLARVDGLALEGAVAPEAVDNSVRRLAGTTVPTTITGISWTHGGTYTPGQARQILGADDESGGLEVRFSAPVRTDTLADGVVDIVVIEGGKGRAGNLYYMQGGFVGLPSSEYTDGFRFRQRSEEMLQLGDRVMIHVRSPFLLDRCCRPLDGAHVGGRVPLLAEYAHQAAAVDARGCESPPHGYGPWTSGRGGAAVDFESWFFVGDTEGGAR